MTRNDGFTHREQLTHATQLLAHLVRRWPHDDAAQWQVRLEAGELFVDDQVALVDRALKPGQWLSWHRPAWEEPDAPLDFTVLHHDAAILAISKPSGLPTLPGAGFHQHTLWFQVRRLYPTAAPVHRLGRTTSGVVLFALDAAVAQTLQQGWPNAVKQYRALASGVIGPDAVEIEQPIGPVDHPRLPGTHAASATGKRAHSSVRVLQRGADRSLVEVSIHTGRPHQIRIHLAWLGHPLVGDPLYRSGGGLHPDAVPGDGGYLLHAHRLEITHPIHGGRSIFEAPLPDALAGL